MSITKEFFKDLFLLCPDACTALIGDLCGKGDHSVVKAAVEMMEEALALKDAPGSSQKDADFLADIEIWLSYSKYKKNNHDSRFSSEWLHKWIGGDVTATSVELDVVNHMVRHFWGYHGVSMSDDQKNTLSRLLSLFNSIPNMDISQAFNSVVSGIKDIDYIKEVVIKYNPEEETGTYYSRKKSELKDSVDNYLEIALKDQNFSAICGIKSAWDEIYGKSEASAKFNHHESKYNLINHDEFKYAFQSCHEYLSLNHEMRNMFSQIIDLSTKTNSAANGENFPIGNALMICHSYGYKSRSGFDGGKILYELLKPYYKNELKDPSRFISCAILFGDMELLDKNELHLKNEVQNLIGRDWKSGYLDYSPSREIVDLYKKYKEYLQPNLINTTLSYFINIGTKPELDCDEDGFGYLHMFISRAKLLPEDKGQCAFNIFLSGTDMNTPDKSGRTIYESIPSEAKKVYDNLMISYEAAQSAHGILNELFAHNSTNFIVSR